MTWLQLLATIVTALGAGGLVSLLLYRAQRRKITAETSHLTTQSEVALSTEVRAWLTEARRDFERADMKANRALARNEQLEAHIDVLEALIRAHLPGVEIPAKPMSPPWPGAVG